LMHNGQFENGEPQPLYFPMDHPDKNLWGVFKGMAVILEEWGFGNMSKVPTGCKKFKCKPGETRCCCRWILYDQRDFTEAESLLETHCCSCGIHAVIFLPKFHCELNFIEQCWDRAKSVYRTYPPPQVKKTSRQIPFILWGAFLCKWWRNLQLDLTISWMPMNVDWMGNK
jgi:hypothetical protein